MGRYENKRLPEVLVVGRVRNPLKEPVGERSAKPSKGSGDHNDEIVGVVSRL